MARPKRCKSSRSLLCDERSIGCPALRQCSCAMHTQKQRKHAQQQTRECRNLGISHASEVAKSTLARQRAFNNVPEGLGSDATHLSLAPQLRVSRVWRCLRVGGWWHTAPGWPLSTEK